MYNLHRIRSRQDVLSFCHLLETMALDRRLYRGLTAANSATAVTSSTPTVNNTSPMNPTSLSTPRSSSGLGHRRGNGNGSSNSNSNSNCNTVSKSRSNYGNGNGSSGVRQIQTTASSPSLRSTAVYGAARSTTPTPSSPLVSGIASYYDADSSIMGSGGIVAGVGGDGQQLLQQHQQCSEGGNVKVVVRVRAFVKRGENTQTLTSSLQIHKTRRGRKKKNSPQKKRSPVLSYREC